VTLADMAAEALNDDDDGDDDTDYGNVTPIREVTDSEAAQLHNGQARMAYRLALLFKDRLLYVHRIGWHYWDGKRWAEDDKGKAKRAVLATLRQAMKESFKLSDTDRDILRKDVRRCESDAAVQGVLSIARALEVFAFTVDDLDTDPYLLNVANGTLDLRTMELRPHSPADRITKVTTGAYDPDAYGPVWDKFITRVLPNEAVRGFVQRYVGTSACGRVLEHKLAIFTGEGRNGKGVFYGAAINAMGDYGDAAEPELLMHRDGAHPTGTMDLRGQRFVVVAENDKDKKLAEATVKRLTGGDRIKARKMREDFVWFTPSHTPVLVTNHLPKVSGDDPALWARLRVVPFDVVIPEAEQDVKLPEKLEVETDAILAWIIRGWQEYARDDAGLQEPEEVKAATARYKQDSDAYSRFVADECHVGAVNRVKASALWERWQRWAKNDGADESSQKVLGQALERMGFEPKRTKGVRSWVGLALNEDEPEDNPYDGRF
jgi:putative DNA primase/helicase